MGSQTPTTESVGHTKGPWRRQKTGIWGRHPDGSERLIAGVYTLEVGGNWEANARLIAAAPEMFAVLKDLLQGFYTSPRGEFDARIHAVIAKAEGREVPTP